MPFIRFSAVRLLVPIAEALAITGWRPLSSWHHGGILRGPCPIHGSATRSSRVFQVSPALGLFRCWKCGATGDVIELWRLLTGLSHRDAALQLASRFGLSIEQMADQGRGIVDSRSPR